MDEAEDAAILFREQEGVRRVRGVPTDSLGIVPVVCGLPRMFAAEQFGVVVLPRGRRDGLDCLCVGRLRLTHLQRH